MQAKVTAVVAAVALICMIPAAGHALTPYSQDFETMSPPTVGGLLGDNWLVYGNAYTPDGTWMYGYGTFPAPNDGAAFCAIAVGEGGVDQGAQQLSVYGDYNNQDQASGILIEANVFQEQTIEAGDVGITWVFIFNAKMGNLEGSSTAAAFIKTLDPNAGYATTNFITADMTTIPTTWGGYGLQITIDAGLVGQLLQFGFTTTETNFEGSGIFYDNVVFGIAPVAVPDPTPTLGAKLMQNYPNPFNPSTRIDFSLDAAGPVDLAVYDLAGRRVALLRQGVLAAGAHHVVWDGRTADGRTAAAGQYRYVLRTATGTTSRSMVLVK